MVAFAKEEAFDYVVVAQDDPLALGMVDALAAVGIPAFGPDKAAARIEASKVFSKDLMKKYGIPTAKYETFDDPAKVMAYIRAEGKYPVVIKADGLALGKGVLICQNEQEAADGVKSCWIKSSVHQAIMWWSRSSSPAPRSACCPSAMERPSSRWSPAWTTSVRWTMTKA